MRSFNNNKKLVRRNVLILRERELIREQNAKEYEEIRRFEEESELIPKDQIA